MRDNDLLKMNLQYFADGNDGNGEGQGNNGDDNSNNDDDKSSKGTGNDGDDNNKKPEKTYSKADLDKIIADKKAKWQQAAENAKKLEKMSNDQKSEYQLKKAKEEAENSKNELAKYRMQDTAREMAKDAGIELSHSDIQHVVTADADSTKTNIDWLTKYTNRVKKSLKSELLKGNPPKTTGSKLKNKKESTGARLAKANSGHKVESPYFK